MVAVTVPPPTRRCTAVRSRGARCPRGSSAHAEMHRGRGSRSASRGRFLRPRGDAPRSSTRRASSALVPPPTRRCTPLSDSVLSHRGGSSAHAEMHPSSSATSTARTGFLRPRGDAPTPPTSDTRTPMVPPPTRRCTDVGGQSAAADLGSSAHAEMHPATTPPASTRRWFLRPRGDAPPGRILRALGRMVPPPTRRCTHADTRGGGFSLGSSAHAEMHRRSAMSERRSARFLRPRGDAPDVLVARGHDAAVPPPTRRCTVTIAARVCAAWGSSAHAEMHPWRRRTRSRRRRFLRPRGDAPYPYRDGQDTEEVPPPTRRCTRAPRGRVMDTLGSSAHAEMHPVEAPARLTGQRFLRPRGDAPITRCERLSKRRVPPPTRRCTVAVGDVRRRDLGSSAHAEMHPASSSASVEEVGFLRPRGDAPLALQEMRSARPVPPPTRRCTPNHGLVLRHEHGSSAHAEMHPRRRRGARPHRGFLRPRGDAPLNHSGPTAVGTVPPPTRRCTSTVGACRRSSRGSSAHAEMHPSLPTPRSRR